MKKSLLVIAAVCAAAACFSACNSSCGSKDVDGVSYGDLNAKLNSGYSQIKITVLDTFDSNTSLVSEYTLKYADSNIKVSYTVERFNTDISLDGAAVTDSVKTLTGEILYENGKVVSGDLDIAAVIPSTGLSFKEEYFENAKITDKAFNADVKDASGFMGSSLTCTEMKVSANYLESFTNISITYKSSAGSTVQYTYAYTK